MTDHDTLGEMRESEQRKKFWTVLGAIMLFAIPIGAVLGFNMGRAAGRGADPTSALAQLPPAFYVAGAILFALTIIIGTWKFVKVIDEVELADNLWGSAAGFYFYSILFPCWWALSMARLVPEPNGWLIYGLTLIAGTAAYAARKLQR